MNSQPSKVVAPAAKRPPNAGKGRAKGVPNKTTAAVREMVIQALERAGGVEYLARVAKTHPAPFLALVGKVMPLQVTGEGGGAVAMALRVEFVKVKEAE